MIDFDLEKNLKDQYNKTKTSIKSQNKKEILFSLKSF